MKKLAVISLMLILMTMTFYRAEAGKEKTSEGLIGLSALENVFGHSFIPKDVAVSLSQKNLLFYVLNADRQVVVYNLSHKPVQLFIHRVTLPDTIAVDSAGRLYVSDVNANQIALFSPIR